MTNEHNSPMRGASTVTNEQNYDFRVPNLPILHQGWLCRKGWTYGTWKKSYAVLKFLDSKNAIFAIYRHETEAAPLTLHEIKDMIDIKRRTRKTSPIYEFTLVFNKAEFVFGCDNEEDVLTWIALMQQVDQPKVHRPSQSMSSAVLGAQLEELTAISQANNVAISSEAIRIKDEKISALELEIEKMRSENQALLTQIADQQRESSQEAICNEIQDIQNENLTEQCPSSETCSDCEAKDTKIAELQQEVANIQTQLQLLITEKENESIAQILPAEWVNTPAPSAPREEKASPSVEEMNGLQQNLQAHLTRIAELETENEELHQHAMRQSPDHVEDRSDFVSEQLKEIAKNIQCLMSNIVTKSEIQKALQDQQHSRLISERANLLEETNNLKGRLIMEVAAEKTHRRDLNEIRSVVKGKVHSFVQDIEASEMKVRRGRV